MSGMKKSDSRIVVMKPSNKGVTTPAEMAERSGLTKGNSKSQSTHRAQCRIQVEQATQRVRSAAKRVEKPLIALLHHVSTEALYVAFMELRRGAAVGVDRQTWCGYEENLLENLQDLYERIHRGAYRGLPIRRVHIPKPDGGTRPLGVMALEDKIVQKAVVDRILTPIYEEVFLGFNYGFRPGRGAHPALDALAYGIKHRKINWILDADIQAYFDTIDRRKLVEFLEKRIGDKRVLRLIQRWLKSGVLEDGTWSDSGVGTVQGAIISPILSNIYLHYVLDMWFQQWRKRARGDVILVRYADDYVVGFQHKEEAENFLRDLKERFKEYCLELHPDKTRLIKFGRYAVADMSRRNQGKPETFNFLGFTHFCTKTRKGYFRLGRKPIAGRMIRALKRVREILRKRVYAMDLWDCGRWLAKVLNGWLRYYAVPGSSGYLAKFVSRLRRMWLKALRRRSQRSNFSWSNIQKLTDRLWPKPTIQHPWPEQRFAERYNLR